MRIFQYKIRKSVSIIISAVILLIPVLAKSKLLLFGERTYGEVLHHKKVKTRGIRHQGTFYYSKITFNTHDTAVEMWGAQNKIYEVGTKVKIAYNKKNPLNCMVLDISYVYDGYIATISGFLLLVWIAAYSTFWKK